MSNLGTELIKSRRMEDLFVLSRYMYRTGSPIIIDGQYDILHKHFEQSGTMQEYVNRTYDDDPVPTELLKEFGLQALIPLNPEHRQVLHALLESEKSTSIKSYTEWEDVFNAFQSVRMHDVVASLKCDGLFTQKAYRDGDFVVGLSRGRTGECRDYTDGLNMMVPRKLEGVPSLFKVYSEGQAKTSSLEYLRSKYGEDKFKTEKSSAMTMFATIGDREDYENHMNLLTFRLDGIGDSLSESLLTAEHLGFRTVPWMKIPAFEAPDTIDEFVQWFRPILDELRELQLEQDIGADGVVVEIDNNSFAPEIKGQYSSRNFAVKLEHWSFSTYPAKVKRIITTDQGSVWRSCRIEIEPFVTADRTTAKVVNGFNTAIIQENSIFPGYRMYFARNSGAVNILIHGGKLKELHLDTNEE